MDTILVLTSEPIAEINPNLHGHFAEHLGELVYPGIYVGPESAIPNTDGIRNDVIDALKPLQIPVLRWPGGCFADTYHWRDGIGPREKRPKRVNVHWGMAQETNAFGTHEFMAFCRALGAEPYFAANLGSAPPSETRDWIEYCNFPGSSSLADERRANGNAGVFGIRYWGIGNELWGCGGNMEPKQYAREFSRYRNFAFDYPGTKIDAIACGPADADWNWTRTVFETLHGSGKLGNMQGFAAHYYCGTAGTATEYTDAQWLELLAKAAAIDGLIHGHRQIMDEYDPQRRINLIFDEWGTWHPVESGKPQGGLYQQNTMRDACVAAITLNAFHNNADKVAMANIAQLINVLQALLLVDGEHVVKTPTYHVFDLYRPHKGATALRCALVSETISDGGAALEAVKRLRRDKQPTPLQRIHASASRKGDALTVTVVNNHPAEPVDVEIRVHGAAIADARQVELSSGDIHDRNTFEHPDCLQLSAQAPAIAKSGRILSKCPLPRLCVSTGGFHSLGYAPSSGRLIPSGSLFAEKLSGRLTGRA